MLNNIEMIVLGFIFVMLSVITFKPIKSVFKLDALPSCILAVCVAALCVISMRDVAKSVLLPYAALGLILLLLLLVLVISRLFRIRYEYRLKDEQVKHKELRTFDKRLKEYE